MFKNLSNKMVIYQSYTIMQNIIQLPSGFETFFSADTEHLEHLEKEMKEHEITPWVALPCWKIQLIKTFNWAVLQYKVT